MKNKYPLSSSTWDDKEIKAINKVIDNNQYTMGKHVDLFENAFSKYIGSKFSVMVNSGSSANLLTIASLFYRKHKPLKRGDEVIVPAVSWSTTYNPLLQYGLKLKFVDIDLNTLNYDLEQLNYAITENTKLLVLVNLLGNPNDFNEIKKITKSKNIIIVEDNCESMGAEFEKKKAGTFGEIGTFSSFFSHHISTMEGGIIVTNDEELYHIILSLRAHGWTRNLPNKSMIHTKAKDSFEEQFKFILPGYNLRPLEMSGAIGIEQLKKLPLFINNRIKNAKYFQEVFSKHEDFTIQTEIGKSSWFGFSFIINECSKLNRKELIKYLLKSGIETRPIVTGNFINNPVIKYFDYEIFNTLSNANRAHNYGFFIGNHHYDIREEIDYLKLTIDKFINENK
jgi:CDP-4-dehydro-6-deoxyglucose reductase, E1